MLNRRTPDFRVRRKDELAFYCEVKHSQKDAWLDELGGARPDPTYNRVANYVHSAAAQFAAVNPDERVPNVLAIVNEDNMASYGDLQSVITGNCYPAEGPPLPMFCNFSEGRIREERYRIHLYLWFDVDRSKPHMLFSQSNPVLDTLLCDYFGVKREQIKQLVT